MPHALSQMGILLGCCVIVWAGLTAGFGLYLQTRCAKYLDRGTASFASLSKITYPNAAVVFDGAIAIKCFGVGVSYLIIIGDLMPGVVRGFSDAAGEIGFLVDRQFWVTAFMCVSSPGSPYDAASFADPYSGWVSRRNTEILTLCIGSLSFPCLSFVVSILSNIPA